MAIKFSQFVVETDKANVNYLVGWDGAENVQITPADLLSTFASGSGTTGFIPKWTSSSNLGDSILEVNSALPDDVLMPRYIRHSGDTNTSFGFPSNDTFVVSTSGSEVMRVTSAGSVGIGTTSPVSKLQVEGSFISSGISQLGSSGVNVYLTSSSAGNVGVGTSSPSEKLEVVGNVKINGTGNTQLILESGGPCDVDLLNAQSEAYLRTTTAHDLYFRTTNLNRMVIKAAGNVGIGTTAPGNKLHVNGGEIQVVNGQTGKLLLQNSNNYLYGDQNGVGIFNANNNLRLYTVGSERIRITSAGNVGIGTTSPSHKLEVNGNIQATGTAFISSSFDANHYMRIESNSSGGILKGADGGVITTLVRTYGDSYFNGGNVGIGTTTPDYKLEVQGVISSADAGLQKATFANVGNDLVLTANADATNATANILFKSSGTGGGAVSEKMRIDSVGNVGIGTATPVTKLHVNSSNTVSYIHLTNSSTGDTSNDGVDFGVNGSDVYLWNRENSSTIFGTNGTERMRVDNAGNVLFGTTGVPNGTSIYGAGFIPEADDRSTLFLATSRSTAAALIIFYNPNGVAGSISISGSATAFNTSSDYRLKEDLQDFAGLDMVSKIPVYDFKWKTDESRSYGVMAHELQEVLPDAVTGEKDAEEMQGVDYSKIVPILIKSIQELKAEIELLKQ